MSVEGVLDEALRDGVYLYVEGNKLRYVAAKNALSQQLKKKLEVHKREVIERLTQAEPTPAAPSPLLAEIPALERNSTASFPLSFGQRRLWFFHQYQGPNAVYNMPLALRVKGEINEPALVRALKELHRRHESLRTRFETRGGGAVQVLDPPELDLEVETRSAEEVAAIVDAERTHCFELSRERLCRIRLLREAVSESGDYVLLITMHHCVADGWSLGILFHELVTLYRAYANGEPSPLAPLPVQYPDYAHWQQGWLQGSVIADQLSYWREQLDGLPQLLTLPTDRPRPAVQTFRGSTERFVLPRAFSEKLQALSHDHGVTLYMTLLTAFAVLLGRYAAQDDVAVGTPIANRTRREIEGLVGFFVNTLVMRQELGGDPRFVDLLKKTRETAVQAYAHQEVPFEQLVEDLNPDRNASHSPLFQVMFAMQNAPVQALEASGLAILPLVGDAGQAQGGAARFDLTLNMQESAAGLAGALEYNTDLFDRTTIQRMLAHFARLLEAIVASPQARLSQLRVLDEAERRQQLSVWNEARRGIPREKCIHELFEVEAQLNPEAIVLADHEFHLTYRELNDRANRLAHRLIEHGITSGSVVGLCVGTAAERAVGALGILKTGAAFVPMHAAPRERLDFLIEDSEAELLVTPSSMSDAALQGYPDVNPRLQVSPAGLACVNYVSNDAGVPTGSMIGHASLLESCDRLIDALLASPESRSAARCILDARGEFLPVGVAGDLYLGGEVGWGFRHRARLTAQCFVPDAFSAAPGARLWRTGQRARWNVDGKLELVTRTDDVPRLARGWRARVELALSRHEAVREVAVTSQGSREDSHLAAYVVARAPAEKSAGQLVAELNAYLRAAADCPPLPREWTVLEILPRTTAGAVDRSALPRRDPSSLGHAPPRTALECALAEVWQEQLELARVGVDDNYFALGGDSIRSIGLVAEAQRHGLKFSIKDLFAHPTIARLAAAIERGDAGVGDDGGTEAAQVIEPFALLTVGERERLRLRHDVEDAYPLSMMQQGLVVESLRHAELTVYQNGHCYGFDVPWNPGRFMEALRHLMDRHPMLRTVYDLSGERPLQLVLEKPEIDLKVVDLRHLDTAMVPAALDSWAQQEAAAPLDLSSALWRLTIHVLGERRFIFGMFIHHAQWDGWSLESFATELYATYGQLMKDGHVTPRRPPPSFRHFVALEQAALTAPGHREYWTRKLSGAVVPWWTGREKSHSTYLTCEVSPETSERLTALSRTLGVQEKSVWCAAYLALLSLLSGREGVAGTVMTQGRPEIPGGEKTIGVFLNALPLRARTSGRRWADLITATDRELREQHAYRRFPLAEIQRLSGLEFSAAMFGFTNFHVYYEGIDREGTSEDWIPQKVGGWQDTNYLLNFIVHKDDRNRHVDLSVGLDSSVFDAEFRERIRGYTLRIIDAILRDTSGVIENSRLLGADERQKQLIGWSAVVPSESRDDHRRFIGEARAYVLSGTSEMVPVGVVGELCLGGAEVPRGQVDHARLMAEMCVPDPFAPEPGGRLWRTGDLVRYTANGKLEFIGRKYPLSQPRELRPELDEVEAALAAHEHVREAVVVAIPAPGPSMRIAAYVVRRSLGPMPTVRLIAQLKSYLRARPECPRLPDKWRVLDAVPRRADGSVDHECLPAADAPAIEHVPPEGATEELLAKIWCAVLKRERVGRHENFFELGGHSLLATQMVSRIRETFSTELPVRDLFEHVTLATQARAIEHVRGAGALEDVRVEAVSRSEPLPLSYAQQRLWFLHRYMGPSAIYNMPLALRLQGEVDESALVRSLEELYARHESLRTRFEARGGGAVQVIDAPGLGLEVESVSAAEAQAISYWERSYRFDLSRERLCRVRVLREITGEQEAPRSYLLLVTMHHIVSDGWSLGIFFRELVSLYRAYANGEDSPLAPLSIQYADYAQWQRRRLQGEVRERQVSYWRQQLQGLPPLLALPTDRPRPAEQTYCGSVERFAFPTALAEELEAVGREYGVTLYMILLSAFAVLLGRYSGQQDVAIGTPIANRTRRETEGLIGFFVNTLVMRHNLAGDPRFVDLLKHTRTTALQAYAHQDIPFEQLVEELNPGRSLGHSPLFQVMFALQNTPFDALELPGVTLLPVMAEDASESAPEPSARFDLTLSVQESAGGLVGVLEYNTDLFERATISRILSHYSRLLESIAKTPQARLSQLQVLRDEDRHRQLVEWNPARALPRQQCVHALFEEQANASPETIAVIDQDRQLTRRELEERANRVAHRLIEHGVAPGSVVGLSVEGLLERSIGALGILKAGGVYVALEADPTERFEYLREDCGAILLVTQSWLCDEVLLGYPATNPHVSVNAADLACMRYEPGEHGVPVARMVPHAGALGYLPDPLESSWMQPACAQPGTQCGPRYILDERGELLPEGVVGDVYVGGETGWGYLHRPGLTAERFVPDAFSLVPGARMHWTGERARWTSDGVMDRVETPPPDPPPRDDALEIEQALAGHESLREAAVLASDDGRPQLVAYVVERTPGSVPAGRFIARLKAYLRAQPACRRLPREWVMLEALPRSQSGAVDRAALPRPAGANRQIVAPRTALESALVEVWQEQLNTERIGVDENYFALGGDSIRSIGLVAAARQRGIEFSIKDLFAHPTVSALAAAVERGDVRADFDGEQELEPFALLTEAEREWLRRRHDLEDAYPLSMMQQGMVVESLRHADLAVYENGHCYCFNEAWDPQRFEQALRHLMARHPMLRTVFDFSFERPLQLVLKEPALDLQVVDVRHLATSAVPEALEQWAKREVADPLQLSSSLWRLTIHILSERRFIFGMFIHHAQWDGWSLESFATELYATYGQLMKEGQVTPRRPPPSFRQFIALEQSALSSPEHRDYWTHKLDGAAVPWWTGREKSHSTYITCEISQETSDCLATLARTLGVQEKSVWCAAYLALLSLLSGTDEGLGTVITQGRPEIPGGEKIVGVFLNALPIRAATIGRRWADLITETDSELREQHAFRQYPLAEIQRLTALDFSAAMFSYVSWHVYNEGIDGEGTPDEWLPQKLGGWQETNYLLNFIVYKDDRNRRFELSIGVDSGVFDAAFRERIRGYTVRLVDAIARDATAFIDKAALLGIDECQRQLVLWNAVVPQPAQKCIHELFEAQVERMPDAVAVVHEGQMLSYAELNTRANRLAHCLRGRGVGPDARVGICVGRGLPMIVGLLGILKAGGGYVPLDPGYPRQRLSYLLGDSNPVLLLVDAAGRDALAAEPIEVAVLDLDVDAPLVASQSGDNPEGTGVHPGHLAYVIYTSGSTGKPKGVMVEHRNVARLFSATAEWFRFGNHDIWSLFHSMAFDFSVWEIWGALLHGGRLVVVPQATVWSPEDFYLLLCREQVSVLNQTPSAFTQLIGAQQGSAQKHALRRVVFGGEALQAGGLARWFERNLDGAPLMVNMYGITETCVHVTYRALRSVDSGMAMDGSPIGTRIPDLRVYLLDRDMQPVPIGVAGEIHVGGAGVARGYLQRPALTSSRFVPDPFAAEPGAVLYKAGDVGRFLADGSIEYLGRNDEQVKVRGYRIELGEIESVLRTQGSVRDAVVLARDEEAGGKRLVAYVAAECAAPDDEAALVRELRGRLQAQLPGYMVPSALMVLPAFPLTANGKLDRKALPVPAGEAYAHRSYEAPQGEIEEAIARLWQELLHIETVGRHDNFFELGGHSLLALRVCNHVRQEFGVELKLARMFANPSVAELSEHISLQLDAKNLRLKRREFDGADDVEEGSF